MPPKSKTIDPPFDADPRAAEAISILRTLEDGQRQTQLRLDSLRIEEYVEQRPSGPRVSDLKVRLKRNRAEGSAPKQKPPRDATELPPSVLAALELIRNGVRPSRRDRTAEIRELEGDLEIFNNARREQQEIVNALRGELSAEVADRLRDPHRALVLQAFRAAQSFAASIDELRHFRSAILSAGYEFRSDFMPEPTMRSALIIGSEFDHDSEISCTRRLLETLEILK